MASTDLRRRNRRASFASVCIGAVTTLACSTTALPTEKAGGPAGVSSDSAGFVASEFDAALADFARYDRQGWTEAECERVAERFLEQARRYREERRRILVEAHYNAGLSYQRCGDDEAAEAQMAIAAEGRQKLFRAAAQLALYEHQREGDLDATIAELERIVRAARFQDVETLVQLAALQMDRGKQRGDGADDLAEAKKNLQRALAIDDDYLPAMNQLALYYLETARARATRVAGVARGKQRPLVLAGSERLRGSREQLDLAALVVDRAIAKRADYAPIHNTAGLVAVELESFNTAVESFERSRQLDPELFEAHMNYAAINVVIRAFEDAEEGYRAAIGLHPDSYEAHLGLALSLRGQVGGVVDDPRLDEADALLSRARRLEPGRPEGYYNRALLYQTVFAKTDDPGSAHERLLKAMALLEQFIERARHDPALAEAVRDAKQRRDDIQAILDFQSRGP